MTKRPQDYTLRDAIDAVAVDAAVRGNLHVLNWLLDRVEDVPFVLEVLDRTQSWTARVLAAELVRDFVCCIAFTREEGIYSGLRSQQGKAR